MGHGVDRAVGVAVVQHEHARACAGDHCGESVRAQQRNQARRRLHERAAVRLVQLVFGGFHQQVVRVARARQRSRVHRTDQQGGARDIEHGIGERHNRRQRLARLARGEFEIGDEHRSRDIRPHQVVHRAVQRSRRSAVRLRGAGALLRPRDRHAAVDGGCHVVWVPFQLCRVLEDLVAVEFAVMAEGVRRRDARHNRLGRGPHAACLRNAVVRLQDESGLAQAEARACTAERGDDQMRLVARQRVRALAVDDHLRGHVERVGAQRELQLVVVVQRESHGVESRAEVGAGRGHTHVHLAGNRIHRE